MKQTILITGGMGMVGQHFKSLRNCIVCSRTELDVTDPKSIENAFTKYKPIALIHLAAMTNVDYAESHQDECYNVNAIGVANVARACGLRDIHFLYVSTAAVFSGRGRTPFSPLQGVDPVNVYARSKVAGELFTRDLAPKHTVVRTGWLFGGFEGDHKFVGMMCRQIWDGKKELRAVDTTRGCPTYTGDLVEILLDCVEKKRYGIVHAVNSGSATRLEITQAIVKLLNAKARVRKIAKQDLPKFPAPRPKFEVIKQTVKMRHWKKALAEYIHTWEKHRSSLSSS